MRQTFLELTIMVEELKTDRVNIMSIFPATPQSSQLVVIPVIEIVIIEMTIIETIIIETEIIITKVIIGVTIRITETKANLALL